MFERYTETARRTIFFARYEASRFGSSYIETEHLLLGVLREDKGLANQLLASPAKVEEIRKAITDRTPARAKVSTSVDLPLTHEAKRALAYGSEECERLQQKHIGPEHLLLGLLREEKCFAAQLLRGQGVTLELVRERARHSQPALRQGRPVPVAGFYLWIAACEADSRWTVERRSDPHATACFAIYGSEEPGEISAEEEPGPAGKLAQTQRRIELAVKQMERAIATHEFEKARHYSDEERKEREQLRRLCEEFKLEAPPPRVPLVIVAVIGDELFSALRERCETYMAEGISEVWLLDTGLKRAYTVTKADGLREVRGDMLRIGSPPLEMDLGKIFG